MGSPTIVANANAQWMACRGVAAAVVESYLLKEDYVKAFDSPDRTVYTRHLDADSEGESFAIFNIFNIFGDHVEWASLEKIVVKVIRSGNEGDTGPILVVGAAAEGKKRVKRFTLFEPDRDHEVNLGETLPLDVLNQVALKVALQRPPVQMVDPSPWMEPIDVGPWPGKTPTDIHLEEERKSGHTYSTNTSKSRYWQGTLHRNGNSVIVSKYYRYTGKTKRVGRVGHAYVREFVKEEVFSGPWRNCFNPDVLQDPILTASMKDKIF